MKLACALALVCGSALAACDAPAPSANFSVPVHGNPFGVVASSDGCWLFVSLPGRAEIAVLSRGGGKVEVKHTVKIAGEPTGMVLTHDARTLIVAAGPQVLFVDAKKLTGGTAEMTSISDGQDPGSVYVNVTADDKTLFVSEEAAASISVIDLEHGRRRIGGIPAGRAPIALTFSADEKYLYSTSQVAPPGWNWPKACTQEGRGSADIVNPEGAVIVVDVARARTDPEHSVVSRVAAGCSPVRLALAAGHVYVTARNSNAVVAFDEAKLVVDPTHARLGMTEVGPSPVPVIAVSGGKTVIAGNSNRFAKNQSKPQMLDVLAGDPLRVTGHIPAGSFPREMRLSPDGNTLFLTNFRSGSVQILDLKRVLP
jgi:DNA-binding beta-propeller fold protein YncE